MRQKELLKILPRTMDYIQVKHGDFKGWYVSLDGGIDESRLRFEKYGDGYELTNAEVHGPFTYKQMVSFILDYIREEGA